MSIEWKKTTIELNVYGTKVELSKATAAKSFAFYEKIERAKSTDDVGAMFSARRDFIVDLGMPENVYDSMETQHLDELTKILLGDSSEKK